MRETEEQATTADSTSASKFSDDTPMSEEAGTVSNNREKGQRNPSRETSYARPPIEKMSTYCSFIRTRPSYSDSSATNGNLFGRLTVARTPALPVEWKFDGHVVIRDSRRGGPSSSIQQQGSSDNQTYNASSRGLFSC